MEDYFAKIEIIYIQIKELRKDAANLKPDKRNYAVLANQIIPHH